MNVLTKITRYERMLVENDSVNFEVNHLRFFSVFGDVHLDCELVALIREVVRDLEGLAQAFNLPRLLWLSTHFDGYEATSHVEFDGDGSAVALQEC